MSEHRHAYAVLEAGQWDETQAADSVSIDHDRRFRRRIMLETNAGRSVLLDLPQAVRLRHGDGLLLADGGMVLVCARPEALLEVRAAPALLLRIAWHLGNRHLPVQFLGFCLRLREDHVIAEMVTGLGGQVSNIDAPFDPEAGAYAGGHRHHDDGDGMHGAQHAHD